MQRTHRDAFGPHRSLKPVRGRTQCSQRGVATVEAVIMLPIFGLLLVGTLFVREVYVARQQTLRHARQCAWQYALDGCAGELPSGCAEPATAAPDASSRATGDELITRAHAQDGGALDIFEKVPLLGNAIRELLGTTASFTSSAKVRVPWLDKTSVSAGATIAVLCNTRPRTGLDVAKNVLCQLVPFVECR